MKVLDDTKLRPGDIILSTQDHYVSAAIRHATKSDISHAMVYVARGSLIDSTGEGVHARNTRRIFFDDESAVHVRRLAAGLTDEQCARVINYVRSQIGTRYSKREAVRSATVEGRQPSRRQFCSRLVAQAYAWSGIRLVDSPDYCTPEDLKNSAALTPVSDALMLVSDDHVEEVAHDFDTNDAMREATNKVLEAARTRSADIENFRDIDAYLVGNPSEDDCFAKFYEESGYLTAWKAEFDKNLWQYELPLLAAKPGSQDGKRTYCVGVVQDHGDMLARHDGNRAGYTVMRGEHQLETFERLRSLYETLVDLQMTRRAVALEWLERFSPQSLQGLVHASALIPHTEEWFAVLKSQNPQQAQMVRVLLNLAQRLDVCTFCGDSPASNYRFAGSDVHPYTVITCKLCDDCREIRKARFGEEFEQL